MNETDKPQKSEVALKEEKVLEFWNKNQIFKKSLEKEAPNGNFVFYDGPPFATGLPHQGTLLGSIAKDLIPRYKTMRGFNVRRRWGWDCHGLPIENIVEKKLGLKHKKDIEEMGIEKFNEECRSQVLTYVHDWKKYIERVGRWVDFDGSYKTMDISYTESVWWALKRIHEKGMLYEGRKVLLYCPRCETPLARAEIAMDNSYKDITEEAVTVEFKLKNDNKTSFLAWTTTPWTLPGNVALAVHPDVDYVTIEKKDMGSGKSTRFILAKKRLETIFEKDEYKIIETKKGADLVGLEYEPLYEIPAVKNSGKKVWYVAEADFVNTEEGTGIVHTAVIYGEDDYQLGLKIDLPMVPLLLANGHYSDDAPEFIRGVYIKKAEKFIKEDLEKRGLLFNKVLNTHSYPHCYRCETPLIYNALSSWFIDIQKIKKQIIELNENINWVPDHLKHGRFLDIIENAPDWAISRNRFWASPLPIWKNSNGSHIVIGGVDELKKYTKKSGNKYFVMRHGEGEHNVLNVISSKANDNYHLTEKGLEEVKKATEYLKKQGITKIISSPFIRTKETVEVISGALGLSRNDMSVDDRLSEHDLGSMSGQSIDVYRKSVPTDDDIYELRVGGGENLIDIKKRTGELLYEIDKTYKDETILFVTHEHTIWAIESVAKGLDKKGMLTLGENRDELIRTGEIHEFDFVPLPHNTNFELDLHRPYIDDVVLVDEKGNPLKRIPEVIDCWVESGSMPFAEYNYPYSNKKEFEKRTPGDFIAEYIAQTRTWFYYMHVLSVALFGHESFKNVLTTGNVLAGDGSKISKSKNNYTDPLLLMDRFGADALRYYMMTSVVMQAEDLTFKDDDVKEVYQRVINILRNILSFYEMYKTDLPEIPDFSKNILDKWIIARLAELHKEVTESLDKFDTIHAGRPIRYFIEDFSTWYLRRSRNRFKSDNPIEQKQVSECMAYVFVELSKIVAPFIPFLAEEIYQSVKGHNNKESVHLENWPETMEKFLDEGLIKTMQKVRNVVSSALELRQKTGHKVRQPLASLIIPDAFSQDFLDIIADEVNVKEVKVGGEEIKLDTHLTEKLKNEGMARDIIRGIQDARKKENLSPNDKIKLIICTGNNVKSVIDSHLEMIKFPTQVTEVIFSEEKQLHEISLEGYTLSISLKK